MKNQIIYLSEYHRIIVDERANGAINVQYQELDGDMWRPIGPAEAYADMDTVLLDYGL